MKTLIFILITFFLTSCNSFKKDSFSKEQMIVSSDITNFWKAYDSIQTTNDTVQQMDYLQSMFLNKASIGQKRMMQARNYQPEEYLNSIKNRPAFWNSIRKNMEHLESYHKELKMGVDQLANIYPDLKPAPIYYTIGNFRSSGTGVDGMLLIGSEYALGDLNTVTYELKEHVQNYYKINPTSYLRLLAVHEYIHTQQKPMVYNLLSLALYEGIAEFVAIKATGQESPWKAFSYGPENEERIKERFEEDMFKPNTIYKWIWNSPKNEFETADLGYFIGYQLASIYYDSMEDKKSAIKTLIELDYEDEVAVEKLVDGTNYFSYTLENLYAQYESKKPEVVGIEQFDNHSEDVDSNTITITLKFSEPMNTETRGFDYGPLGEEHVLRVQKMIGFSEDGRSFTFEVELKDNHRYQSVASERFVSAKGYPLKPYLIDFKTK